LTFGPWAAPLPDAPSQSMAASLLQVPGSQDDQPRSSPSGHFSWPAVYMMSIFFSLHFPHCASVHSGNGFLPPDS
jgi:hypothetical protein